MTTPLINQNRSYLPTNPDRSWYVVDAEGQRLGRLAVAIAMILRGKNKPTYTPHLDTGDFVIVINASRWDERGNL
jgi:large subunit ribosomal protein L13